MDRTYFTQELYRLCEGYRTQELTKQRMDALFRAYGALTASQWSRTVDRCLEGSRFPTARDLEQAVAAVGGARGAGGSGSGSGSGPEPWPPKGWPDRSEIDFAYGAWRLPIVHRIGAEKLRPAAVAALLEERRSEFPAQEELLDAEIEELQATGKWRDVSLPA